MTFNNLSEQGSGGFRHLTEIDVGEVITAESGNTQSIHDALADANDGDTVGVPAGTYNLSSPLIIDNNGLTLSLDSGAEIIRDADLGAMLANAENETLSSFSDGVDDVTVEGGTWDVNSTNRSYNGCALSFGFSKNITIQNTTIKNVPDWHHIEIHGCSDVDILNVDCDTLDSTRGSITDEYGTEMIQVEPSDNTPGIYSTVDGQRSEYITISECSFAKEPTDVIVGIGCHGNKTPNTYDVEITNCTFSEMDAGVHPYGFDTVLIEDCTFESSVNTAITDAGSNVTTTNNTVN